MTVRLPGTIAAAILVVLLAGCALLSPASSTNVRGTVVTESISYEHDGVELEGYLARPDTAGLMRPGVLVVHQWMGLGDYEKMRARRLADLGYVALAADVYGADTRPSTTHEASLAASTFREQRGRYRRRLMASLETLRNRSDVDPDRLAAIGYCFGGTGVLELARSGADLDAVVSFHGGLANPRPEDAGNIRAAVQVHHGGEDPHVTPEDVLSFWNEMNEHASVDWTLHVYSKAPHGFTEPGTEAHDARADRLSWRAMVRLFEEVFGGDPETSRAGTP